MANLEPCFRSQILCGRYFNLPGTFTASVGLCIVYVYTHTYSLSIFLMISWCSVHAQWQERKKCHNKAIQQLPASKRKHFSPQRGKKGGWYFSFAAVKIGKGMPLSSLVGQAGSQIAEELSQGHSWEGTGKVKDYGDSSQGKKGGYVPLILLK